MRLLCFIVLAAWMAAKITTLVSLDDVSKGEQAISLPPVQTDNFNKG